MRRASEWSTMTAYQVTGDRYAPTGELKEDIKPQARNQYSSSWGAFLCFRMIESRSSRTEPGKWRAIRPRQHSIPSRSNSAWQTEQAAFPCINAIPCESEHKFMATLHKVRRPQAGAARQGRSSQGLCRHAAWEFVVAYPCLGMYARRHGAP